MADVPVPEWPWLMLPTDGTPPRAADPRCTCRKHGLCAWCLRLIERAVA